MSAKLQFNARYYRYARYYRSFYGILFFAGLLCGVVGVGLSEVLLGWLDYMVMMVLWLACVRLCGALSPSSLFGATWLFVYAGAKVTQGALADRLIRDMLIGGAIPLALVVLGRFAPLPKLSTIGLFGLGDANRLKSWLIIGWIVVWIGQIAVARQAPILLLMTKSGDTLLLQRAREASGKLLPKFLSYPLASATEVIVPLLMGILVIDLIQGRRRWYSPSTIVFVCLLVLFQGFTLAKSPILFLAAATGIVLIQVKGRSGLITAGLSLSIGLVAMVLINSSVASTSIIEGFNGLINRVWSTPATIASLYYRFFGDRPVGIARFGFSELFGIQHVELASIIYQEYSWGVLPTGLANANYIADAYATFGLSGVIAYSLLFGVLLLVCEASTRDNGNPYLRALSAVTAICTCKVAFTSLPTVVLTHGLLLCLGLRLLPSFDACPRGGLKNYVGGYCSYPRH